MPTMGRRPGPTEPRFHDVLASCGDIPAGETPCRATRARSSPAESPRGRRSCSYEYQRRHSFPALAAEDSRTSEPLQEHAALCGLLLVHSRSLCVAVEPANSSPFSISEASAISMPRIPEEGALVWYTSGSLETRQDCFRELTKIWRQHSPGETADGLPLDGATGNAERRQASHTGAQAPEAEAEAGQHARRSMSASGADRQRSLLLRARQLLLGAKAGAGSRGAAKPWRRRVLPVEPTGLAWAAQGGPARRSRVPPLVR